ncbi:hypothetical protein PsorP6_001399 [Peronosclerospora sorghi]|uniref:Uncharacterized protein n=1 Tax=Peronosclerospora sorghi TaxID=230839 RepID=A0ACC0WUI0_9STRA|nr:hypothetical protein PsorP6_001399 [Peronosclerospora sorghi]
MYCCAAYALEDHGHALYCVTFCDFQPIYGNMFAAAGGNRNGGIYVIQVYCDGDQEEHFFTAAWTVDVLTGSPRLAAAGFRSHIKLYSFYPDMATQLTSSKSTRLTRAYFSAGTDESTRLLNSFTGLSVAIFAGHVGHRNDVSSLDGLLKGSFFVSSAIDNTKTRPFDTKFIQFPAFFTRKVHADYVDCVQMSTGNRKYCGSRIHRETRTLSQYCAKEVDLDSKLEAMAVGNKKSVVSVFDLDAEQESSICELTHNSCKSKVRQVCFSKSGRTIITCSDDATVWRWDLL